MQVSFIEQFPRDLLSAIVDYLPRKNVAALACACKIFNNQWNWPREFHRRISWQCQEETLLPILAKIFSTYKPETSQPAERIHILYQWLSAVLPDNNYNSFKTQLDHKICLFTKRNAPLEKEEEVALAYTAIYKKFYPYSHASKKCFEKLESNFGFSQVLKMILQVTTPQMEPILLIPLVEYGINNLLYPFDEQVTHDLAQHPIILAFNEMKEPFPEKTALLLLRKFILFLEQREDTCGGAVVQSLYRCIPLDLDDPVFKSFEIRYTYGKRLFEEGVEPPHPSILKNLCSF